MNNKSQKLLESDCIDAMHLMFKIRRSDKQFSDVAGLGIPTYLSLVVEGIDKLIRLPMNEYPDIRGSTFESLYKKSRARTKIYSDKRLNRYIKDIKSTENKVLQDLTKDYNLIQKLFIKLMGQETLGVYYLEDIPIYNNFIGYIDLIQVLNVNDLEDLADEGNSIFKFSSYLSEYINEGFNYFGFDIDMFNDVVGVESLIANEDFHLAPTYKNKLFIPKYDLSTSIFLYNIFCSINYVVYVLSQLLNEKSNLFIRIKLICYYSSVESLDRLQKGYNHNSGVGTYKSELEEIIAIKRALDKKGGFRNNISHYEIVIDKDETFEKSNESTEIFDSILKYYTLLSRTELNKTIDIELEKITALISRWILQ